MYIYVFACRRNQSKSKLGELEDTSVLWEVCGDSEGGVLLSQSRHERSMSCNPRKKKEPRHLSA